MTRRSLLFVILLVGVLALLWLARSEDSRDELQRRWQQVRKDFKTLIGSDQRSTGPSRDADASTRGTAVPVFAMFDNVGLYQKNGFVEVYGGDLRQHQTGPVSVAKSVLRATGPDAWVFWSPDASPAASAEELELRLSGELPAAATIRIGLVLESGASYLFEGKAANAAKASRLVPDRLPEAFRTALGGAQTLALEQKRAGVWRARLPDALAAEIKRASDAAAIRTWFLGLSDAPGGSLEIVSLAMIAPNASQQAVPVVSIGGRVADAAPERDAAIELVTESGKRYSTVLAADGTFSFEGLAPGQPVSLRYSHLRQDHYANLGRWFSPQASRTDVVVSVAPRFVNKDGRAPDPKKAKFAYRGQPVSYFSYEPHSRQYWPGAGPVQEFDSTTFSNNYGLIDRDRFFDNPQRCFRIVHLGASTAVSLQVRPFEKYNIVLEQELGVALGKCVEVISVGRDNGDIGALFRAARDYALKFVPDVIMIENSNYHLMQLHPELLRRAIGWNQEHSPLDSFFRDPQGTLQLRHESPKYPLFVTPPDQAELVPGVNFWKTMMVPEQHMHEYGRETFKLFIDIVRHYQAQFPEPRLVINSGLDQAQCKKECSGSATLADGKQIPVGTKALLEHYRALCAREKLDCINPDIPAGYEEPPTLLTFVHDGHFSVRGHQWYAKELAKGIRAIFQ
jgi:hypothetical protein